MNANWAPAQNSENAFEFLIVTEDGERHVVQTNASEALALVALTQATDAVLIWDPDAQGLTVGNLLGQWLDPDLTLLPKEVIRAAILADTTDICRFGEAHVPTHYAPLIGAEAATRQVELWWTDERMRSAVKDGLVTVAVAPDARVVGVAERGQFDGGPVLWKLYVHPDLRGRGLGPRLIQAVIDGLPYGADALLLEHFAGNTRAATFYAREGFDVIRVDEHPSGLPELATVGRSRQLTG